MEFGLLPIWKNCCCCCFFLKIIFLWRLSSFEVASCVNDEMGLGSRTEEEGDSMVGASGAVVMPKTMADLGRGSESLEW